MTKRTGILFCAMIAMFSVLFFRLYVLSAGTGSTAVSDRHGSITVNIVAQRAQIYDCNLTPLVNLDSTYRAAVLPLQENAWLLQDQYEDGAAVLQLISDRKPFAVDLESGDVYARGVDVFETKKRYGFNLTAVHIIGYIKESSGTGVSGIEKAFDNYLREHGETLDVRYQVDAAGRGFEGSPPEVLRENDDNLSGVVLTIDSRIQKLTENAIKKVDSGAVVVMDIATGNLRAVASYPVFDPSHPTDDGTMENSPFVNKAFSAYSVGSTFKLVVAAAALESGVPENRSYTCTGSVTVGGQVFHCHNRNGHGELDMEQAVTVSCNTYFIDLAAQLESGPISVLAQKLGFGSEDTFAEGYSTAKGTLPDERELALPAGLANFGFGQGSLTATPVQIAKLIAAIAGGGELTVPRLVEGLAGTDGKIAEYAPHYAQNRVISKRTAATLRQYMIRVVESGSGYAARPDEGGAGGKTASAQTGVYIGGEEKVEAWFSGFFPAEDPQYVIVVFAENAGSGAEVAAPLFAEIADGIAALGLTD